MAGTTRAKRSLSEKVKKMNLHDAYKEATDYFNERIKYGEVKMDEVLVLLISETLISEFRLQAITDAKINKEIGERKGEIFFCYFDSDGTRVEHRSLD